MYRLRCSNLSCARFYAVMTRRVSASARIGLVVSCTLSMAATGASAVTLHITDLGPVAQYGGLLYPAIAINHQGQVAGVTESGGEPLPFIWHNGDFTPLPNLPGATQVNITGINGLGQVVGFSNALDGRTYAVTWKNGEISKLPMPTDYTFGNAYGINDAGQIVGSMGQDSTSQYAVVWEGEVVTDITLAPGTIAFAINNAGLVAGGGESGGFLWQNGTLTDLSPLSIYAGLALNSHGAMAGFDISIVGNSAFYRAILLENDVLTDLGTAPGGPQGVATAINDHGQIIGVGDFNGAYSFLWDNGQMTSLQPLLPADSPWYIWSVWKINNQGQIVGVGSIDGEYRLVLLEVPEPTTLAIALTCVALGLAFSSNTSFRRHFARNS